MISVPFFRRKPNLKPVETLRKHIAGGAQCRKAIHVGAHHGEEYEAYAALGICSCLWIEASKTDFAILEKNLGETRGTMENTLVRAFASETDGDTATLFRFNNDGSSSSMFHGTDLLKSTWPGLGETGTSEDIATARLDTIAAAKGYDDADLVVVDVQGAELLVLRGATAVLASARFVITEVSQKPFYDGGVLYPELKAFLASHGFTEASDPPVHGDQLYMRA